MRFETFKKFSRLLKGSLYRVSYRLLFKTRAKFSISQFCVWGQEGHEAAPPQQTVPRSRRAVHRQSACGGQEGQDGHRQGRKCTRVLVQATTRWPSTCGCRPRVHSGLPPLEDITRRTSWGPFDQRIKKNVPRRLPLGIASASHDNNHSSNHSLDRTTWATPLHYVKHYSRSNNGRCAHRSAQTP